MVNYLKLKRKVAMDILKLASDLGEVSVRRTVAQFALSEGLKEESITKIIKQLEITERVSVEGDILTLTDVQDADQS